MTRFCNDCGIKHLVCPSNPKNKEKATLNYIEILPISNMPDSYKSNIIVPLQAIIRAQAQANANKGKEKLGEENETEAVPSERNKKTRKHGKLGGLGKQREQT